MRFPWLNLALLPCFFLSIQHQTRAQTQPRIQEVILGRSEEPLYGPWKFTTGDSPVDATGKLLWSAPGFDDSNWETVNLTPVPARLDANGQMPGWGSLGHPGHSGYGWYRIRIRVHAPSAEKLAIAGPDVFDDAYQVFINGTLTGEFGFAGKQPQVYFAQPAFFPLAKTFSPAQQSEQDPDQTKVIAFRFWVSPATMVQQADAGGFHTAPQLGDASAISAVNQLRWLVLVRQQAVVVLLGVVFTLLTALAFALFLYNRTDRAYLWLTISCLLGALANWEFALAVLAHKVFTANTDLWFGTVFVLSVGRFAWYMLIRTWFHLERQQWLTWVVALLTMVQIVTTAGTLGLIPFIPGALAPFCALIVQASFFFYLLAITWVEYVGIRKDPVDGWLFVPVVVLTWTGWMSGTFPSLHLSSVFSPFGLLVSSVQLEAFAITFALSALLIRRWAFSVQEHRQITLDVKQAQEVQRVLIPEEITQIPGLLIESEYRPARQVGGDFFQILAHPANGSALAGSVLIVIGDVTGKGLQAGMSVALLVGAIRNQVETSYDPLLMLHSLNRRLHGRGNTYATAQAILITADGKATLANAGHLPPYFNGNELPMEGALPLGMMPAADFSVSHFQLAANDWLVLLSDGVPEAQNAKGQLFGFERIEQLLAKPTTAVELASAAQAFGADRSQDAGQADDILVLHVTKSAP